MQVEGLAGTGPRKGREVLRGTGNLFLVEEGSETGVGKVGSRRRVCRAG